MHPSSNFDLVHSFSEIDYEKCPVCNYTTIINRLSKTYLGYLQLLF